MKDWDHKSIQDLENIIKDNIQHDLYVDERLNEQIFLSLQEKLEPIAETTDQYLGAEILLSGGDQMARAHVV